ncbi:MAG TPA: DUF4398 domain-containing protein [Bacteriovoracaceae bacterium]|nr:DUF4398 domain-containing protein [Bacteriovoracaceae bacterium]
MKVYLLTTLLTLGSCGLVTTRPKVEMSLAQAAFLAAKESGADIHASNLYRKAEDFYLKAKSAYRRKYFSKAQEYAILSKRFSEQAEYSAVRKKALEGNAE